jgi:putative component of toxin-antitoxin plasmid stabilization module
VKNSPQGIWELRVTPAGGTPPHLRLFYVREGQTLWAALGMTKKSNKLEASDVSAADRIVADWRKERER